MNAHTLVTRAAWIGMLSALAGCVVQAPPPRVQLAPVPVAMAVYEPVAPAPVVSVYIDPPLFQPPPVLIGWAPPPMLVEPPPPIPFGGAVWIGGYWAWQGNWVWAAGRWAPPPQPGYGWINPYYENRSGAVVFVTGHWSPPGVFFVPPPPGLSLSLAVSLPGIVPGPRPLGPPGIFVPPPPGSRLGLIVPAPLGTSPAVVVGAPPVTNVGMRIQNRVENNTTINNTRSTTINNITNVTIVAPATATASGRAFEAQAPALAHLAAAQTPVVHMAAPVPASAKPIAAFAADRPPPVLPAAQPVQLRRTPAPNAAGAAPAGGNERIESAPNRAAAPPTARPEEFARPAAAAPAPAPVPRPPTTTAVAPTNPSGPAAQVPPPGKPQPPRPPAPPKPGAEKAKQQKPAPKKPGGREEEKKSESAR